MSEVKVGTKRASWCHPLAFTTALLTLLMICVGAAVTTIGAGDSDPKWSLRFWEWFLPAQGGLWYEYMHRRLGTIIGFVAIALVISLWRGEKRRWVRRLGYAAFVLICVQGLIGGLRIHSVSNSVVRDWLVEMSGLHENAVKLVVVMVHAFHAQLIFCVLVALTIVTSRAWEQDELAPDTSPQTSKTRRLCVWTCAIIFLQLLLGAYIRHGRELYPFEAAPYHGYFVLAHVAMAIGVVAHIFLINAHTRKHHPAIFPIWHLAGLAKFLVMVQLFLGFGSWVVTRPGESDVAMPWDVAMLVRTGHVANGAMIFAVLVTMSVRAWKLLRKCESELTEPATQQREVHA